jgi:hypothetical protein
MRWIRFVLEIDPKVAGYEVHALTRLQGGKSREETFLLSYVLR